MIEAESIEVVEGQLILGTQLLFTKATKILGCITITFLGVFAFVVITIVIGRLDLSFVVRYCFALATIIVIKPGFQAVFETLIIAILVGVIVIIKKVTIEYMKVGFRSSFRRVLVILIIFCVRILFAILLSQTATED